MNVIIMSYAELVEKCHTEPVEVQFKSMFYWSSTSSD